MKMYLLLILFFLVYTENQAQDQLLWLDVPKKIENSTNVYDKRAKIKSNKVVIPKYYLKVCRTEKSEKFYYKGNIFFDSFKYFNGNTQYFTELYGKQYFIVLKKPSTDTTFHNPISVKREKLIIIDFMNSPEEVFEVDLKGYLLLPSKILLTDLVKHNNEKGITYNGKIGIIKNIDLGKSKITLTDYNNKSVEFSLKKFSNKF